MFKKKAKEKTDILNSNVEVDDTITPQDREYSSPSPKKISKKLWIYVVVAVLVVSIVAITVFNQPIFKSYDYPATLPTKISQEEAYELYKEIYNVEEEHNEHAKIKDELCNHTSRIFSSQVAIENPAPKGRDNGIEVAEIVKQQGEYIYTVKKYHEVTLDITKTDNGKLTKVATIDIKKTPNFTRYGSVSVEGMFIYKNILAVVLNADNSEDYEHPQYSYTVVKMFDISNPYSPEYITEYAQMGNGFYKSYLIENILYVFTDGSPRGLYSSLNDGVKVDWHLPSIAEENKPFVPIEHLYVVDTEVGQSYFSAMSIDLNFQKLIDSMAVVGGEEEYINKDSLCVISSIPCYDDPEDSNYIKTSILKFDIMDGCFIPEAKTILDGQVSILNEYNGNFRVVASIGKRLTEECCNYVKNIVFESNSIYILDKNLKTISSTTGICKGEGIFRVQFLGDLGYFTTYSRENKINTIEYFIMDFSNIKHLKTTPNISLPKGTGKLYFWGDNKLLSVAETIGENRSEEIEFKMLDSSNMANIKEIFSKTILNYGTEKENYTILEEKVIGFANGSKYILFSFNEDKGFIQNDGDFSVPIEKDTIQRDAYFARLTQGIFIDDYLYVCNSYGINSYCLSSAKSNQIIDEIRF